VTLQEYFASLVKSWWLIVALTLVGALGGYVYAQQQTEIYSSRSAVVVVPSRGDTTSELVQGANYVQNLVQTYAMVATSPLVLQPVIDELDLEATPYGLAGSITVENELGTSVLSITVRDPSAETAQAIADAVAIELADAVAQLSPVTEDSGAAVRIERITPARLSNYPVAPNVRLLVAAGAIAGLVAGAAFALLRRLLATRIGTRKDLEAVTDTALLGEVFASPRYPLPTAVRQEPTGAVAESVRSVVAALRFANVERTTKVIMVTSAHQHEGKSSAATSIALILAESGNRVLLIDADLRRASVDTLTQLEGSVGLTTVLLGDIDLKSARQQWAGTTLDVLTSGVLPPNPGPLLNSDNLKTLIAQARKEYDVVLIDSPPVLAVSDPLWLAPLVDGVIMVVRSKSTKRESVSRALTALESAHTRILGLVLNGVKRSERNNPYYTKEPQHGTRARLRRLSIAPATVSDGD